MNFAQKALKEFQKMDDWVKYLLGAAIVVLLLSLFWPRSHQAGVRLVPVPGSSYYRAVFEGFSSEEKVNSAMQSNRPVLVAFMAPWCGYCKKLKPHWQQFENDYTGRDCDVLSVDCTLYKEIGKNHGVTGYPTIKYLPNGLSDPTGAVDFDGERTPSGFSAFLSRYHQ